MPPFRILLSYKDVLTSDHECCHVYIDPLKTSTIRDLRLKISTLLHRSDNDYSLCLYGAQLKDDEDVQVLRDGDLIQLVTSMDKNGLDNIPASTRLVPSSCHSQVTAGIIQPPVSASVSPQLGYNPYSSIGPIHSKSFSYMDIVGNMSQVTSHAYNIPHVPSSVYNIPQAISLPCNMPQASTLAYNMPQVACPQIPSPQIVTLGPPHIMSFPNAQSIHQPHWSSMSQISNASVERCLDTESATIIKSLNSGSSELDANLGPAESSQESYDNVSAEKSLNSDSATVSTNVDSRILESDDKLCHSEVNSDLRVNNFRKCKLSDNNQSEENTKLEDVAFFSGDYSDADSEHQSQSLVPRAKRRRRTRKKKNKRNKEFVIEAEPFKNNKSSTHFTTPYNGRKHIYFTDDDEIFVEGQNGNSQVGVEDDQGQVNTDILGEKITDCSDISIVVEQNSKAQMTHVLSSEAVKDVSYKEQVNSNDNENHNNIFNNNNINNNNRDDDDDAGGSDDDNDAADAVNNKFNDVNDNTKISCSLKEWNIQRYQKLNKKTEKFRIFDERLKCSGIVRKKRKVPNTADYQMLLAIKELPCIPNYKLQYGNRTTDGSGEQNLVVTKNENKYFQNSENSKTCSIFEEHDSTISRHIDDKKCSYSDDKMGTHTEINGGITIHSFASNIVICEKFVSMNAIGLKNILISATDFNNVCLGIRGGVTEAELALLNSHEADKTFTVVESANLRSDSMDKITNTVESANLGSDIIDKISNVVEVAELSDDRVSNTSSIKESSQLRGTNGDDKSLFVVSYICTCSENGERGILSDCSRCLIIRDVEFHFDDKTINITYLDGIQKLFKLQDIDGILKKCDDLEKGYIISFQIWKIVSDYTPQLSERVIGMVLELNAERKEATIIILDGIIEQEDDNHTFICRIEDGSKNCIANMVKLEYSCLANIYRIAFIDVSHCI